MQLPSLKNSFVALSFIALTSLTACSPSSQAQNQDPKPTTNSSNQPQMNHGGGMNHHMNMDLGPADANYDLRFIDAMMMHHQGAVDMANVALQKSQRPEIKKLAANIIKSQKQEISQMQQWRTAWYPNVGNQPMAYHTQMGHMMEMTPEQKQAMMMSMDLGKADGEFDLRFINAMIPHHEGAVVMAKDALNKSQHSEIKKLSQAIIQAQAAEIQQMQQWRKAWYNQ
ncbi:DUF305 domain-containing protein [Nostoc sp. TCL26-01]|uniref:DUF305 domain-containing protein n=1 Tax=Nostoc sp. TCL26-01 TaxID=2576904 RepID=UPI0015BB05FC|nr:DUF305 domain-containing protein [Nostoc sp. TCL26-01]QLE55480.1 DUF305 domain-containing protein [Nostoc sp. TCL26-01]